MREIQMKKGLFIYTIFAIGLILFTGILAMLLGILEIFTKETNQYIIETISGFLGAAFFTCLLARIKTKQWEKAWEKSRYLHLFTVALLFFLCRVANRLMLGIFLKQEMSGMGYTISVLIDITLIIGFYFCLPKEDGKTTDENEKTAVAQTAGEER